MFIKNTRAFLNLICIILLFTKTSCTSKRSDFIKPFYKTFSAKVKGKDLVISLYRDTANQSNTYSGSLTDASTGIIYGLSGSSVDSADLSKVNLQTSAINGSAYQVSGKISNDAAKIDGKIYRMLKDTVKTDSTEVTFSEFNKNGNEFTYYAASKSFEIKKSGYVGSYDISFVWPVKMKDANTLKALQSEIAKMVGLKNYATPDPLGALFSETEKDFNESYNDVDSTGMGDMQLNTSNTVRIYIEYIDDRIACLSDYSMHYESGMAHEQWGTGYTIFDLRKNKELTRKDILTKEGLQKLSYLVDKYFRIAYNLKPHESLTKAGLFKNKISPNNNVYLTDKQLIFHYGNYEIAPFSAGEFEVAIPLSEFNGQLLLK